MLLTGWKEIAGHLRHGVRTVQRWEADHSLPVRRICDRPRQNVLADSEELDVWLQERPRRALLDSLDDIQARIAYLEAENAILRSGLKEVRARFPQLSFNLPKNGRTSST